MMTFLGFRELRFRHTHHAAASLPRSPPGWWVLVKVCYSISIRTQRVSSYKRDCEGIVAKYKQGTYTTAGPPAWFKIRNPNYAQHEGRQEMFERFWDPGEQVINTPSA